MIEHTPGPWIHTEDDDNYHAITAGCGYHVNSDDDGFEIAGCISKANAKLIAAAPDLLEALERILEQPLTGNPYYNRLIEHWEYERSLGNGYAEDQLFAISAIARARGEA